MPQEPQNFDESQREKKIVNPAYGKDWWGTAKHTSPRLQLEYGLMRKRFGDTFALRVPKPYSESQNVYWEGDIEVNLAELPEDKRVFTVRLIYPAMWRHSKVPLYPSSAMSAMIVNHQDLPDISHIKDDDGYSIATHTHDVGVPCLFNPSDGKEYGWNPSKSNAIVMAGWCIDWLWARCMVPYVGKWIKIEHSVKYRD